MEKLTNMEIALNSDTPGGFKHENGKYEFSILLFFYFNVYKQIFLLKIIGRENL